MSCMSLCYWNLKIINSLLLRSVNVYEKNKLKLTSVFICLDNVFMVFYCVVLSWAAYVSVIIFFYFFPLNLLMFTVSSVYLPLSCHSHCFNQTSESLKFERCQHNVWISNILNAKITTGISAKLIVTFVEECSETLTTTFRHLRYTYVVPEHR